jgi:DNA-binding SARP family transcriptional activator
VAKAPLRLYVTGRVMLEGGGRVVDETRLPGRQGPVALVYLALAGARPVPIDELGDAVWGEALPRAWETALSAIVSKLRAGRFREAWGPGNVAASIAGRPLLAGVDLEWIERARHDLQTLRVRAFSCLASAALANAEWPLAAQFARTQVELEPFRETGWQQLMRALAGAGNRAEALRAYGECRDLLRKELGIAPSPETEAIVTALRQT